MVKQTVDYDQKVDEIDTSKWKKRNALIEDEQKVQKSDNFESSPSDKTKFFVTFPFPYMNGRLHLGHAYTISKAEFIARFMMLKGYNVLFPFGFHGTGTPIDAAANNLKKILNGVELSSLNIDSLEASHPVKNLARMGVPIEDIPKFTDPKHWIVHFPEVALDDLKKFGLCVDFSRSFMTTDINPYFDSFVKWQFNVLNARGVLKFGKKYCIFSPLDDQVCADHSRKAECEGIKPKEYITLRFKVDKSDFLNEDVILLVTVKDISETIAINNIIINQKHQFVEFSYNNEVYVARPECFRNLQYQLEGDMTIKRTFTGKDILGTIVKGGDVSVIHRDIGDKGTGLIVSVDKDKKREMSDKEKEEVKNIYFDTNTAMIYCEPESEVISRSNDRCVVALKDQWYICYGDEEATQVVNDHINNVLETFDEVTKYNFRRTSEWLNEWPCSRSTGLGTKLLDTEFLIDSLSDSTIYMAFYTVANRIGQIPVERMDDSIWNYIFLNGDIPDGVDPQLLNSLKDEFNYWYPVDLRVSGKDLVGNHLTMCMYNHQFVWGDKLPKAIFANGHALLNGQKMSKSTGNFMTLEEAVTTFGADATRIALAEAGGGTNDANFVNANANNAVLRLSTEKDWYKETLSELKPNNQEKGFWDKVFEVEIDQCILECVKSMEMLDYHKALVSGFYELLNVRDRYRQKYSSGIINMNHQSMLRYVKISLNLLYPFCPHLVETVWNYGDELGCNFERSWIEANPIDHKTVWLRDTFNTLSNSVRSQIVRKQKKSKEQLPVQIVNVISFSSFSDDEMEMINQVKEQINGSSEVDWNMIKKEMFATVKDKKKIKSVGMVVGNAKKATDTYSLQWLDWISNNQEEYEVLSQWLPIVLPGSVESNLVETVNVSIQCGNEQSNGKNGPGNPSFSLTTTN